MILIVVALVGLRIRDHLLGEELVREVNRLSEPRPNAPKQLAIEGNYLDCVSRLPPVPPALAGSKELTEAVAHLRDEGAALDTLPQDVRHEWPGIERLASSALECARASTTATDWRQDDALPPDLTSALRHGIALSVRERLHAGAADEALDRCKGITLWARAVADPWGLGGAMHALATLRSILPACVDAIDHASPSAKQKFVREVQLVRASYPTFSSLMRMERADNQLTWHLLELTDAQRSRLPESAQSRTPSSSMLNPPLRLMNRLRWGAWVRAMNEFVAASDSPTRDAEFAAIFDSSSSTTRSLVAGTVPGAESTWLAYAHGHDHAIELFDFLLLLARVDLRESGAGDGGWEYSLDEDGKPRTFVLHPDSDEAP